MGFLLKKGDDPHVTDQLSKKDRCATGLYFTNQNMLTFLISSLPYIPKAGSWDPCRRSIRTFL